MNGVQWLFVIAGALVLAVIVLYILFRIKIAAERTGRTIREWIRTRQYAREARIHNEKARQLRLEKDEWFGFPLPTGQSGTLRISRQMLLDNPNRVSQKQLEKQYETRGLDLWIDIWNETDVETGDMLIKWEPKKEKRPREVY